MLYLPRDLPAKVETLRKIAVDAQRRLLLWTVFADACRVQFQQAPTQENAHRLAEAQNEWLLLDEIARKTGEEYRKYALIERLEGHAEDE